MKSFRPGPAFRAFAIGLCLAAASALPPLLRPAPAPAAPDFALEALIPPAFGEWRVELVPPPVDPVAAARAERVYGQTLARSYVDAQGRRIMLSVAYGTSQVGDSMQAHRPEYCYKAQGFTLSPATDTRLDTGVAELPLRRLVAQRGDRSEPISYWMTIGTDAMLPGLSRKLAQLGHGLAGSAPDGLLVRVSSLETEPAAAYALHDRFIGELVAALPPEARERVAGKQRPTTLAAHRSTASATDRP